MTSPLALSTPSPDHRRFADNIFGKSYALRLDDLAYLLI